MNQADKIYNTHIERAYRLTAIDEIKSRGNTIDLLYTECIKYENKIKELKEEIKRLKNDIMEIEMGEHL